MKNYLRDKGAVFRQPQADISQKRSDFIPQAEGLCISNFLNQKWFVKTFLILSILLSSINEVSSQVACSPPGIELVDNPGIPALAGFHRSGETRSDTFYSVTAQDIDGGHAPAVVSHNHVAGHSNTVMLSGAEALVDNSISLGQGSLGSPANNAVLIYMELAKKGELDTLTFETVPFQVSRLHPNFRQKEHFLVGRKGSFLEGVNPVSDQMFLFESYDYQEPGYFSLKMGEEGILENYLLFPGDSIKVRIQDVAHRISFAGPDAALFECQYQMALAGDQRRFSRPSQMITDDAEKFLSRDNYRDRYLTAKNSFGSSLELVEYGKEELEEWMEQWNVPVAKLPEWKVLESYRDRISPEAYEILLADLIGNYRAALLGKFRNEMYGRAVHSHDSLLVSELKELFLEDLYEIDSFSPVLDFSSGWLFYQYEQAYLKALITNTSFSKGVQESYSGDLMANILLKFLMDKFQQIPTKSSFMERIAPFMVTADQKGQLEEYRSKYVSGIPIQDFLFEDRKGKVYSKADFADQLTLFYFWSTGCGASENFYQETFDELAKEFRDSEQVTLVAVNASPTAELWKRGLSSGNYTSDKLLNLYMGAEAQGWKSHYNIHMFPQLMMMDPKGRNLEILFLGQDAASIRDQIESALSVGGNDNVSSKD
ncbi:thiol-disulfide isomerase/thioredoxin [Algoriphagus iocasae]|uniref:Thiol-disulfide isomerase/thioredoxin n=1 Tax=Algoriphagus iocasae TaxID=1836499 RepID=A0A841MUR6_9BACT|nr:thioredoxin-like domain-containing protein [Algoriphagus iocasae]MBB6327836.1 thiol-disulfide isomerase/thioredoxin [Algoriphagus iocasae]